MTLELTLPPELETRLRSAASRNGKAAEQYAVEVLEENVPVSAKNLAAAAMLLEWAKEAESMSDEESAENEQILRALDEDRMSDRKLFAHLFDDKTP